MEMDQFPTGATRSKGEDRPDFSGYLSAWAMRLFGDYMLRHQVQADGERRTANNWKKGMPVDRYVASLSRHYFALSEAWDRASLYGDLNDLNEKAFEEALGGILFNAFGLAHEWERAKDAVASFSASVAEAQAQTDTVEPVVRRRRGRPRKDEAQPRRKRGRPRRAEFGRRTRQPAR